MAHIITLAHRVSSVHARYSRIHSAAFAFSFSRLLSRWRRRSLPDYCRYQSDLEALNEELEAVAAIVAGNEKLQPETTFGREFTQLLAEYIEALSDSVVRLETICGRICREARDGEAYGDLESRSDRIAYDRSIQYYRRLGERLNYLFGQL